MQNLKYISSTVKKLQKASKYRATSYGMIAIELLKSSKISLQKTIDINDAALYINGLNQTLQDETEFISYLIKYKNCNLADVLVTQLFKNITKDKILYITICLIYGQENQNLQMMICQCALNSNIVIADKLFQKMPLPDEIPLQSHDLTQCTIYIYIYMCVLIVVLLLNPGT